MKVEEGSLTFSGPRISEMDDLIAAGNIEGAETLTNAIIDELSAYLEANDAQPEDLKQVSGGLASFGADERLPFLLFGFSSSGATSMISALDSTFTDRVRLLTQTLYRLGFIAGRQAERTENAV